VFADSLSADSNITDLLQRENSWNFGRSRGGMWKRAFGVQKPMSEFIKTQAAR